MSGTRDSLSKVTFNDKVGEEYRALRLREVQLLSQFGQILNDAQTDTYEVWEVRHQWQHFEVALRAPQLQPTAAYKASDWRSIGAGPGLTPGYLKDQAEDRSRIPGKGDGSFENF